MLKKFLLAFIISLTSVSALSANIFIPGYDTIHFKAGKITQEVMFRNPIENKCSFMMRLTLEDGTEVWTADQLLYPGEAFIKIDLEHVLERGIYRNAVMKYECYTLDGGARLNGAEIRITLEVK